MQLRETNRRKRRQAHRREVRNSHSIEHKQFTQYHFQTKYATGTRGNENETTTLCDTCNRNQEMKVYQLGRFSPSNPKNEDNELEGIY